MKKAILGFVLASMASISFAVTAGEALRELPVQDNGRIKPYDTFARETLEVVYGKKTYEQKAAWEVVLTWMLAPSLWSDKELFEVRSHEILKVLELSPERRWFKAAEVFEKTRFSELMQELQAKRETKEKLTPYFQALQRLETQFFIFREMAQGHLLKVLPPPAGDESGAWLAVSDMTGPAQDAFLEITKNFVTVLGASDAGAKAALDQSVLSFREKFQAPAVSPQDTRIHLEVHYNDFHPFRWAYSLYTLAALLLLVLWIMNKPALFKFAVLALGIGFLLHTYGFAVRVYLAGRPPVSNMYETVVWVAWGGVVFASVLEFIYRSRVILLAGALAGTVALVVADVAPAVLDPSLQPLEAVLRSNYWLIVHVMTITISYAAFFLAWVLSNIGLVYYLKEDSQHADKTKQIVTAVYRSMQIGVAFLAPGIILGGVWADYSWGRFWGWDPKETWALIVLLGYLAILHGRLTQWIKDFGMLVSGVLTFSLVIMAWYGVNFILGAGLHSYGFGAGGVEYMSAVIAAQLLFVIYVSVLRRHRLHKI